MQILVSIERYIAVLRPIEVNTLLTRMRLCLLTALMFSLVVATNLPYLLQTNFYQFAVDGVTYTVCTKTESNAHVFYLNHSLMNTLNFVLWWVMFR